MDDIIVLKKAELSSIVENAVRRVISDNTRVPKEKDKDSSLTINDVSDLTGYKVGTIYSKVHKKTIPFRKCKSSKKLIFLKSEIDKWMLGDDLESPQAYADRKERAFDGKNSK